MADVKKIRLPNNEEVNIKDYRIPGVDTTPTSGSDNVITSGGVYAANYAGSNSNGGPANMTVSIPFAKPDSTSTSTVYTVQVPGITELRDGVCFYLMNNKVTSAANFTVNVNNLGAKPVYMTTAAATRAGTQMSVNCTWLLVYNETRVADGCWDLVYTFNSNTTYTLNYLFDGSNWYLQHILYRYQLMFQVDEKTVTPFNANANTTGTTKTIHTDYEFDPFGKIFYYTTTSTISANATVSASYCAFVRSAVDLRYTFNVSTSVNPLSLDYSPVYLKININSTTGMATLNSNLPLTQTLPTTNDGIYYLYLGRSTNTKYTCSLEAHHPIYYHNGTTLCELLPKEILAGIENNSNFVAISDYEDDQFVIATSLNDLDSRLINIESTDFATTTALNNAVASKYTKPATGIPASDLASGVIPTVPTISTNIQTDKASNVKTASPKAVYNEIHPAVASAQPQRGFLPNILYNLGTISSNTTFSIATPSDANVVNHYYWTFDTGSTAPTITWPSGISWFGGAAPVIAASSHYEISILNNIAVAMEV